MRSIVACCLLLILTLPSHAQPKPNTLTPKEIADGWILLFDGETTFGWQAEYLSEKKVPNINDDALDLRGLGDCVLDHLVNFAEFEQIFEYQSKGKFVWTGVKTTQPTKNARAGRSSTYLLTATSEWTPFRVQVQNGEIQAGKLKPHPWADRSTVFFHQSLDSSLQLRNFKLRPLNLKSLFNGKDLDGWKEFPGKKSKFAVVDGAINVKDGPGDLQTVGKYKVGSSRVDLQACKLEYSIVSPK